MTIKNEASGFRNLIDSVFAQTYPPYEVIIVDGGSEDRTCEIIRSVRDVRINLIQVKGASPAEGRNIAARAAKHGVYVMIDGGTRIDANFMANIVGPFTTTPRPDLVTGIYRPMNKTAWSRYFIPDWKNDERIKSDYLPSCRCTAITSYLFRKLKGFPEDLQQRWGEDTQFMLRAKGVSSRWVMNRKAVVDWRCPETKEESMALMYRYGMGNGEIGCDKYLDWYMQSKDPLVKEALRGYLAGCEMREMQA